MNNRSKTLVLSSAIAALGLIALPQASIAQGPPTFAQLDTDGNGELSKEEVKAWYDMLTQFGINVGPNADAFLAAIDTNGDGKVDKAEFDALPSAPPQ